MVGRSDGKVRSYGRPRLHNNVRYIKRATSFDLSRSRWGEMRGIPAGLNGPRWSIWNISRWTDPAAYTAEL